MKSVFAIAYLIFAFGINSRSSDTVLNWTPLKRVCGRAQTEKHGAVVAMPRTKISLYEAKWRKACCDGLNVVKSGLTTMNGGFDFGEVAAGRYWLKVELEARSLSLPIDVSPKHDWEGSCDAQGPYVEGNSISWMAGRDMM